MDGYSTITTKEKFAKFFPHVDYSELLKTTHLHIWTTPNTRDIRPSSFFIQLLERMDKVWNRNSEATTRTYIDQVIIDVLWNRKNIHKGLAYKPFGDVWRAYYGLRRSTLKPHVILGVGRS